MEDGGNTGTPQKQVFVEETLLSTPIPLVESTRL